MDESKLINNVFSVSGGKDSTATLLVGLALEVPNLSAVFADTGNEHALTYDYIDYLEQVTGVKIQRVKADFTAQLAHKREYVSTKWREENVSESIIERALSVLQPTGIPFVDLCMWKGRFPSRRAQFCTQELKVYPVIEQIFFPMTDRGELVYSWQGVRRDESEARRYLTEFEEMGGGIFNYRPILKWPALATFEAMRYMGVKSNPLYSQGCDRVGCMPCINCQKQEVANISVRFPEHIEKIKIWESLVSKASKQGCSTFFAVKTDPTVKKTDVITLKTHGIDRIVRWSHTQHGGRKIDMFSFESKECASSYGLCE